MHTCFHAAFLILCFNISLKHASCVQIDPNDEIPLPGLYQRGSECKISNNQWKISELEDLDCNKQGIINKEYSCPVIFDFNETFALCQNQNVRSV